MDLLVSVKETPQRGGVQNFKDLRVWQLANALTVAVYNETRSFPADERFGLISQMRSAALSIQSNIAEACGRGSRADMARFIQMAIGSATELENQFHVSRDLCFLTQADYARLDDQINHVRAMLLKFLFKLRGHRPQS